MRAIHIEKNGGPEVVQFGTVPDPEPSTGEVLVELRAAALNRLDLWTRNGIPGAELSFPHVLGADGAGVVRSLGHGVRDVEQGQKVLINPGLSCGRCEFCRQGEHSQCVTFHLLGEGVNGTFAEFVAVPSTNVRSIPEGMSFEDAAALPLVTLTAWRMIVERADLRPGETVLIHGIGGGVSSAALSLCVTLGARVIVTSSSDEKLQVAEKLGAWQGINYTGSEVGKTVRRMTGKRGVDLVVDSVGNATWKDSIASLRKGGRLVTCGATTGPNPSAQIHRIFWNQLSIIGSTMGSHGDFDRMLRFVESSGFRVPVDRVLELEAGKEALGVLEAGEQYGKLVLRIPVPSEASAE